MKTIINGTYLVFLLILFCLPGKPVAAEKHVGMTYSNWFSTTDVIPNYITWGGSGDEIIGSKAWGEPLLGYYSSKDLSVIDQHVEWMADAGVDFVMLDLSNSGFHELHPPSYSTGGFPPDRFWVEDSAMVFVDRMAWRKSQGLPYVKVAIMIGALGDCENVTNGYLDKGADIVNAWLINNPQRNSVYFYYKGRPLLTTAIIGCAVYLPPDGGGWGWGDTPLVPFDRSDFTVRHLNHNNALAGLWNPETGQSHKRLWSWEERYLPNHNPPVIPSYMADNGVPEFQVVLAGTRGDGHWTGPNGRGRENGQTFRDYWAIARERDVDIAMVQSWNEWTSPGEQYDAEYSNDIEPSVEHGTFYLDLLKEEIALFKGVEQGEVTYDFDDGTFQGWTDLTPANNNSGPRSWAISPPAFPDVAHSGSHAVGQHISGGTQDSSHPTLWLRSPDFLLDGSGDLTAWLRGGSGSGSLAGSAVSSVPAQSSEPGFQGIALRNANTDAFVLSGSRSTSGDNWQVVRFTAAQLATLDQNANYTLDLIDAGHGGWGWIAMDTVTIPGVILGSGSAGAPTISSISSQTILVNTNTGQLSFTVGSSSVDPGSLALSRSSSNTTLVPNANIAFGGSGANRTVTVTPAAGQIGSSTITITVSDGQQTANTSFAVNVVSGALPVAFNFDNGTMQGWSVTSTDGQERQYFAVVPPELNSPILTPHSGDHFIGLHIPAFTLDEPVYTQDFPHSTLVLRSPELTLNGSGDLTAWLSGGGAGSSGLAGTSVNDLPSSSEDGGFRGIALRDATTGTFVLSAGKTSEGNEWQQVGFTASELAALAQDHVYTLDLIDAGHGGWGWVNMDSVTIPGTLVEEPSIPEMPILLIRRSGQNEVRLSWPTAATGWTLQRAPEAGGEYADTGLEETVEGDENVVYDTILSDRHFYRLVE